MWLDGGILCEEAKRYVGNFLSVHRIRPDDGGSDCGNSDDIIDDEELRVSSVSLPDALATRVGGRDLGADAGEQEASEGGTSHFRNSLAGMSLAQDVWERGETSSAAHVPVFDTPESLQAIFSGASASQRQEHSMSHRLNKAPSEGTTRSSTDAVPDDVNAWLLNLRSRTDANGRRTANDLQYEAVSVIARRVIEELEHVPGTDSAVWEPLRWLIHGGPGTGKSHVITLIKELFTEVLGWDMGVNFQIAALQAVMADQLGGDTIHHACGIPVKRRGEANDSAPQKHMAVAKRVLQWRWLIIDEISMVSARLLADMDLKLRDVIRRIGTSKVGDQSIDRPFGGLNVLFCGDFWQLDPPDGGFLGAIPTQFIQRARKYQAAPTIAHGQALFWSGPDMGVQGVTELQECERCKDYWLREVQEQIRMGNLSDVNHQFMHGLPTMVPGSWLAGDVACGRASCRALVALSPGRTTTTAREETDCR